MAQRVGIERRLRVLAACGHRCWFCGVDIGQRVRNPKAERGPRWTIDHLTPQHAGGGHEEENLVAACSRCNFVKGGLDLAGFRWLVARWSGIAPQDVRFSGERRLDGPDTTSPVLEEAPIPPPAEDAAERAIAIGAERANARRR